MTQYDSVVVGLGGAGSAAAYHMSRAGVRVLGLEQFGPGHPHGSSHGRSRIFRTAYSEGAAYVPLVQRAQQLWYQLQEASGDKVIRKTGGLVIGHGNTRLVSGAIRTAESCALKHEILTPGAVRDRFPQFAPASDEIALWDPDAGVLFPENCIRAQASGAVDGGAELHYGEKMLKWSADADTVSVRTPVAEYRARSLVLTAGSWTPSVAGDLNLPLEIERQFMLWFPPTDKDLVSPHRMPVFLWDRAPALETYGVPDFGDGVKVGSWQGKISPTPEDADRTFRESDAAPVRRFVAESMRGLTPHETDFSSCLYTNAPDHNFLLGLHPHHSNVAVVSACSGHGFKFTSVVGEVISRLVRHEPTGFDLSLFDPGRFLRGYREDGSRQQSLRPPPLGATQLPPNIAVEWTGLAGRPLEFHRTLSPQSLDAVYSNVLFNMDYTETEHRELMEAIHRTLRKGGLRLYSAQSTSDPQYGRGKEVGPDTFDPVPHGVTMHYFSQEYANRLAEGPFTPLERVERTEGVGEFPIRFLYVVDRRS